MKITLYTNHCPCCAVQQSMLDNAVVSYNLETDIEKMLALGMTHLPMLQIDDQILNYQAAFKWLSERTNAHEG